MPRPLICPTQAGAMRDVRRKSSRACHRVAKGDGRVRVAAGIEDDAVASVFVCGVEMVDERALSVFLLENERYVPKRRLQIRLNVSQRFGAVRLRLARAEEV